jgi:hypothetical protein
MSLLRSNIEQSLSTIVGLAENLRPKVDERQALIAERDRILAEIATLSDEISSTLAIADTKHLKVGPYQLTLVENPGRLTLDKHRLIELGVSPETLTAATTRGTPSISLQVRTTTED